jgi:hypothetical protein
LGPTFYGPNLLFGQNFFKNILGSTKIVAQKLFPPTNIGPNKYWPQKIVAQKMLTNKKKNFGQHFFGKNVFVFSQNFVGAIFGGPKLFMGQHICSWARIFRPKKIVGQKMFPQTNFGPQKVVAQKMLTNTPSHTPTHLTPTQK